MSRPTTRTSLGGGLALAVVLTLAACGGSGDDDASSPGESGSGEDGLTPVTAGYFPLVHTASAVRAQEAGYFEEEGLDVDLQQTAGGAQAIPALVSGEYDLTYANYTSIVLAAQQGLDVQIFSGNDVGAEDHALMVAADSDITDVADLEGASVAVNNLQNIGMVAVRALVEEAGGDPDTIEFLEMPYPEMAAGLTRGDVDAIWQVEPFQAFSLAEGHEVLTQLFSGPVADMPVAGWATTGEYSAENAETLEAFQRALGRAMEDLNGNRELLVELVPTFTEVSAETVGNVAFPQWTSEVDVDQLQYMEDLMFEHGITAEEFDVTSIIVD